MAVIGAIRVFLMVAAINLFIAAHAHSEANAYAAAHALFGGVCVGLFVDSESER